MDDGLYDNQVTCRRECWVKGRVRDYVAARIIQEAPAGLFNATWSARWGTYPDVPRRTVDEYIEVTPGDATTVGFCCKGPDGGVEWLIEVSLRVHDLLWAVRVESDGPFTIVPRGDKQAWIHPAHGPATQTKVQALRVLQEGLEDGERRHKCR